MKKKTIFILKGRLCHGQRISFLRIFSFTSKIRGPIAGSGETNMGLLKFVPIDGYAPLSLGGLREIRQGESDDREREEQEDVFPPPSAASTAWGEQFSQFKKSKSTFYLARECCLNRCVAVSCGTATASSRFCVRGFCATLGIAVSTCMAWFSWADILS